MSIIALEWATSNHKKVRTLRRQESPTPNTNMKTTLNKIRFRSPCKVGWEKLLAHLGKTKADKEPLPILTILDSNGFGDALWCLRAVEGYDKKKRLLAVSFARRVQHLMRDQRSIAALNVAERYANGKATDEELKAAAAASSAAAWVAAAAAASSAAASSAAAADAAAKAAAWDVAKAAAWAALYAREASTNPSAELEAQEKLLREMLTTQP